MSEPMSVEPRPTSMEKLVRNHGIEISNPGSMWAVQGTSYFACDETVKVLPSGFYEISRCSQGVYFIKKEVSTDDLLLLPDSASAEIIAGIEEFWEKEDHFRKLGFLWKRGVLMWGPAGGGKTCTVQMIAKRVIESGGITVFTTHPAIDALGLSVFRHIEPTRPIVVVLEDLDAMVDHYGESEILSLLDGELQIDNVVFLATTNYPEKMDSRITNRPSRFDVVKHIGMPSPEARAVYLGKKYSCLNKDEFALWVEKSEGFSIAHLKELIVSVEVFGIPFEDAISRLVEMMNLPHSDDDKPSKTGFAQRAAIQELPDEPLELMPVRRR